RAALCRGSSLHDQASGLARGFHSYSNVAGGALPEVLDNTVFRRVAAEYRVAEQYLGLPKAATASTGVEQEMSWRNKGRADVTTEAAIAQLESLSRQPFFMWIHYFDPHYPYLPRTDYDTYYPDYQGKL